MEHSHFKHEHEKVAEHLHKHDGGMHGHHHEHEKVAKHFHMHDGGMHGHKHHHEHVAAMCHGGKAHK